MYLCSNDLMQGDQCMYIVIESVNAIYFLDGPFCTCPMCNSDREISVTTNEGLQLAKDIGGTYLELLALNYFYVVKYFGGVVSTYKVHLCHLYLAESLHLLL